MKRSPLWENRLRGTTREMHEREISSERGAREGAILDREQGRKELAELHAKHETVLSEFRQLQMSSDSRVSQLDQELRMTRFELEAELHAGRNLVTAARSFIKFYPQPATGPRISRTSVSPYKS